jgi:hypothetical protein
MRKRGMNCHRHNSICCKTGNFAISLHKISFALFYCFTSNAAIFQALLSHFPLQIRKQERLSESENVEWKLK